MRPLRCLPPLRHGRRTAVLLAVIALAAVALPWACGWRASPAAADGSATTVTGSWFRWDVLNQQYDTSASPQLTVDQTQNLVDQVVHVAWQNLTPSFNGFFNWDGTPMPTAVYQPDPSTNDYTVDVYECGGSDPQIAPGDDGSTCYDAQSVQDANGQIVNGDHGAPNAVPAVTHADGTGSADVHVETRQTNDLVGCDPTHPCSIVLVPNNGGYQPDTGEPARCDDHSADVLNADYSNNPPFYADGNWVTSECAWADRLVVPLHFAPLPQDCPTVDPAFNAVGSPMLARGLSALQAAWCADPKNALSFNYNSTVNEYQARSTFAASSALTAGTDVALVTTPAGPGVAAARGPTYAPVLTTSIDIAYEVDDPTTGTPITDLRLDARLVAKLLTQSYAPYHWSCQGVEPPVAGPGCDPATVGNPGSIFDDPEFQVLNFRGTHADRSHFAGDDLGVFYPIVVGGNTDLVHELTRWVESDPDAAAFLAGHLDPWGMHVNTAYTGTGAVHYPLDAIVPQDPGWTPGPADPPGIGAQGTINPVSTLPRVSTYLAAGQSATTDPQPVCPTGNTPDCVSGGVRYTYKLVGGSTSVGTRELFGIVDGGSAASYQFPVAQLVTAGGVAPDATAVGPTTASLAAAVAGMATNPDTITQYVSHAPHSDPTAYPLTVVDYAMVPTCGLAADRASAVAGMLDRVASTTAYGVTPGTIPTGYFALTPAQAAQTSAAGTAVRNQTCTAAPADTTMAGAPATDNTAQNVSATGTSQPFTPSAGGAVPGSDPSAAAPPDVASSNGPGSSPSAPATGTDLGYRRASDIGSSGIGMDVLLAVSALLLVATPVTWFIARPAGSRWRRRGIGS